MWCVNCAVQTFVGDNDTTKSLKAQALVPQERLEHTRACLGPEMGSRLFFIQVSVGQATGVLLLQKSEVFLLR